MERSIARIAKNVIRSVLPLSIRKKLCIYIGRQRALSSDERYWWTLELLRDYAKSDSNGFHRFLWSNHLGYADTYNVDVRFGVGRIAESRRMFFDDLKAHLSAAGIDPSEGGIQSVMEVGCSLGYQLRYLETTVFPGAVDLIGIDIDRYAIERGSDYLGRADSRVRLMCGDMSDLGRVLEGKTYDIMISTGVLMYLDESQSVQVVDAMLRHAGMMIGLSGPAHSETDNAFLEHSVVRENDGAFIHNLDAIVAKAGGTVIARRWEGRRIVEGHTIYFVFARKA